MQAGTKKLGVIEASYASAIIGVLRPVSSHCSSSDPRPMPPAGNWLRFSGSLPPWLVLSHNMPMINTAGKLASFWRFSLTDSSHSSHSLATDHWPLTTVLSLHADPPRPAGSGRAQTFPRRLLPSTDRRIGKDRTGPNLDERSVHIQYVTEIQYFTEPGNFF